MKLPFASILLGNQKKQEIREEERVFQTTPITEKDIIAPASISVKPDNIKLGNWTAKSFFIFSYPRYLSTAWLSSAINLDVPMDISIHIHPVDTGLVLKQLSRK